VEEDNRGMSVEQVGLLVALLSLFRDRPFSPEGIMYPICKAPFSENSHPT
jgi:hypothetical protein